MTSLLALLTTFHVALLVLRRERSAGRAALLVPAVLFCAAPWIAPSAIGLAAGAAAHLAWFAVCEKLVPAPAPPRRAGVAAGPSAAPAAADASLPSATPPLSAFRSVRVLAVVDETADIRTFRMERPTGFAFRAGQFLTVRVPAGGRPVVRCYSISSPPEAAGVLEISVKRQGQVSGYLHERIRPGALLEIGRPGGEFVYPGGTGPLVLLAGGVGITPLASMLRHALLAEPARPVTLVYSVKGERDIAYRDELSALSRRHPQARLVVAISAGPARPGFHAGRVDAALLARAVPDPSAATFLLCGPQPMIDGLSAAIRSLGVPQERIRSEAFAAAVALSAAPAGPVRLTLTLSGTTVETPPERCLLDAVEDAGGRIASLCRAGACGTCRTRLVRGQVEGAAACARDEDRTAGFIYPCVTYARGDCALEA